MAEEPKPGSIVHVEFHVKEPKKVEKFYGSLFGWKFEAVPGMDYSLFEAPSVRTTESAGIWSSSSPPKCRW